MKIKVVGIDPALSNLGIATATVDITDPENFKVYDLKLAKTEDGKLTKAAVKDGKAVNKRYLPKGVSQGSDDLRRAKVLSDAFLEAARGADLVIAEIPIGSQSARAMASYGVSLGVLASCPVELIEVSPADVKMAGCNDKTATKHEMIDAATSLFPDAPWIRSKTKRGGTYPITTENEHLADACFVIRAGIRTPEFQNYVKELKSGQTLHVS